MNIYVGNLDFEVDEIDLKEIFEEYGAVKSSRVITDKFSGRSKGFGFVEMEDKLAGSKAISDLQGATLENRIMRVNEAKPKRQN